MRLGEVMWPAQEHTAVSDKLALSLLMRDAVCPLSHQAEEVVTKRSKMEVQMPSTFYIFFDGYCWKIIDKSLEVNLSQRNYT